MQAENQRYKDFNRHLFCGDRRPEVAQVLNIRRNGVLQPFAARYVLNTTMSTVPIAPVLDCFVPIVHMAERNPYSLVYDGKMTRRHATRPGNFMIRDRRVAQYTDNLTVNNVSFYIPMPDLADLCYQLGVPEIRHLPSQLDTYNYDPTMFHFAKIMEGLLGRPAEACRLFSEHIFSAVCLHLVRQYAQLQARTDTHRGGLAPQQRAKVQDLLLADLRSNVGIIDLAMACGMSQRHFTRAFKESTGLPPHRWLSLKRVERAQSLLRFTKLEISAIALECGFADQSHLTRVFSKSVGVSPAVWRRNRHG